MGRMASLGGEISWDFTWPRDTVGVGVQTKFGHFFHQIVQGDTNEAANPFMILLKQAPTVELAGYIVIRRSEFPAPRSSPTSSWPSPKLSAMNLDGRK